MDETLLMNPLFKAILMRTLRWALQGGFAWMIERGMLHPEEQEGLILLILGVVGSLGTLAWIWVRAWLDRRKLLTAAASPAGSTELAIEEKVKLGMAPPVTTPKDEKPKLQEPTPPPL